MKSVACFGQKLSNLYCSSCVHLACLSKYLYGLIRCLYWYFVHSVSPFWIQLCYFLFISLVGFLVLKGMKPRADHSLRPKDLDVFFMSVSATTVSSMSTVEMEIFSNAQLVILTILMFLGGEIFVSMLGLQFDKSKFRGYEQRIEAVNCTSPNIPRTNIAEECQIESGFASMTEFDHRSAVFEIESNIGSKDLIRCQSINYLGYVVLGYLAVVLVVGSALVSVYIAVVSSAKEVLRQRGLKILTFSVFTTVSTFTNCGFIPTNENMIVFKNNSGLLLILIPQVRLGNTLYPSFLRLVIWVLERFTKRQEFDYLLKNSRDIGCHHLLTGRHSLFLMVTVFGFVLVQFILFCFMEWNSAVLDGLSSYRKLMATLFQTVNSRHTGESIVDLSTISPAILILFVVMMYLPPYTSFLPTNEDEQCPGSKRNSKRKRKLVENLLLSPLSYLVIFIILICIAEKKKIKDDPLNFTVLNIVIELISAYGNVGFTTGYSCKRQLVPDHNCRDTWYGFSGRWSSKGKLILVLVMFIGRLKKFNKKGSRRWKLL